MALNIIFAIKYNAVYWQQILTILPVNQLRFD